jgi:hypothetical protein
MNPQILDPVRRALLMALACSVLPFVSACGTIGPDPWEKDLMAKKEMLPNANQAVKGAESHIYYSKEGASGGSSAAGGGCGCN